MSVDRLPPQKARSAAREPQVVRYGEYVDQQIESTRKLVKFVDVATVLLVIATGTIGFLLTAAVVEHWLVPGGYNFVVRLLLFALLIGGIGYYAVRQLWPLCRNSINPAYAAQAIEHDNPTLKNSLLNLLLFRQQRAAITDAVYETLEEQAAKRLTRVPVESAVDRSQLLRLGYVLLVIVAIAAIYKVLSPKDPFVTARRVILPWSEVVPASRVSITNVEPGHITLARGEVLKVSADVRGIGDDDPVIVKFTTADGQAVERPTQMTPSSTGLRYSGEIPPKSDGAHAGVAQNLRYYIEAGDARSLEYSVTVVAAPTITVERVDYDYPDYTGLADRSIERLGDIRAIEGTRVTIHARANQPIDEASLDFEADGRRDLSLQIDGVTARTGFELALRDDRQTAKFTSYVLRFTSSDGRPNRNPVKYPVEVVPDDAPEASILKPAEKVRDVQLHETVWIEVDAIDPDHGLAEVRIHGESAGRTVIDEKLLTKRHTGRFTGRLQFTPSEHNLQPGEVVRYWVTARDERPNETTSDSQTLRIQPPDPNQPRPDRLAQREQREQREPREQQPQDDSQQGEGEQGQQGESGESGSAGQGESSQSSEGEQSDGEPASAGGQPGQFQNQGQSQNQSDQQNQSGESGDQQSDQPGGQGQNQSGAQGGEPASAGGQNGQPGDNSPNQQDNQPGDQQQSGNSSSAQPNNSNSQNDSQQQPGESSNDSGARSNGRNQPSNSNGRRQSPQSQQHPGESNSPVSSDGDDDGEAFDRIQQFLEKDGQIPQPSEEQQSGERKSGSQQNNKQDGEPTSAGGKQSENGDKQSPSPSDAGANANANSNSNEESSDGTGAETSPGERPQESSDPANEGQQPEESKSPGGQPTSSKGETGEGEQPEQNEGAPDSQPGMKPTDKNADQWQQKPGDKQSSDQEPPAGGRGKQESDSQGDQGGDRTGGGEEGGGQKANRDGTGSSGQNQSADEGAGESSEQGAGANSSSAGKDATANERTGQPGSNQTGEGSSQREGSGDQSSTDQSNNKDSNQQQASPHHDGEPASAGGQQGENNNSTSNQESHDQAKNQSQENAPSDSNQQQGAGGEKSQSDGGEDAPARQQDGQPSQNSGGDNMSGAGRPPEGAIPPSSPNGSAPGADDANLDYARQRTNLVLETLADQMKRRRVDKRLLDDLGWTEEDMRRFVERWQRLKAAAQVDAHNGDAQRELDDALRSLGLRRNNLQQSKVTDDTNRDVSQGFRGPVPHEYRDRLKSYNEGVSRARPSDE